MKNNSVEGNLKLSVVIIDKQDYAYALIYLTGHIGIITIGQHPSTVREYYKNVFVKPENKESSLVLAWRENEGEANVFGKPNEQRQSLLGLCHGEKRSVFIQT